ncbi:hypothetical protein THIOSC13_420001 [uncultured Thiomicrorhabdus sp.]
MLDLVRLPSLYGFLTHEIHPPHEVQNNNVTTLITILNYEEYNQTESKTESRRRTDGEQTETPKEVKKDNKTFIRPSYEEVKAYCDERKNSVDPQKFLDHYDANGWVQGKGKPIKDWKACIRTWESNSVKAKKKLTNNTIDDGYA